MLRSPAAARAAALATAVASAMISSGCGSAAIPPEKAESIPVHNPSPDNPLKGVTLENESENVDRIGGISKPGGR